MANVHILWYAEYIFYKKLCNLFTQHAQSEKKPLNRRAFMKVLHKNLVDALMKERLKNKCNDRG